MKISCPSCSAKYSIADDKVQNRLAKIRCRKCGTSIVIDGTQTPPNVYAATETGEAAQAPAATGTVFSVDFGEGDQRQLTVAELVDAYNAGQVNAETYLWTEGYADWTPLGQVEEVVGAIHKAASVVDSNAAAAMSTAPFEDPFPQPPQRSGADLFGGISTAGSERDFATSSAAPTPAAAAKAFGGPAQASPGASGARNESSVLFSLSALTSGSTSSRPSVPAPSAPSNDDSGLIDLKALTEAAAAQARPAPHVAAAVAPVAPFAPAPIAAPVMAPLGMPGTRGASVPPAKKGNTGYYIIGGSIIVAAAAVAALVTLLNKEPPPAPILTQAPAAPTPAPAPAPAALPDQPDTPSLPPATEEPKVPAETPKTTTTAKKPATTKPATTTSKTTSSSSSSSSSEKPAAPAPKPAASSGSKCNCKAGDLMCAMRCSSK